MNQKDEHYNQYFMIHSSQEFKQYLQQNNVYYPDKLESKLLKWNSYPIICSTAQDIEQCFGILFFQMIKISQNQFVRSNFETWINKDLNQQHDFSQLAKQIFKKESLNPFPQSTEFQSIGEQLQEAFIYEKHCPDKVPSIFKWNHGNIADNFSEQDIKYRFLFYQNSDKINLRIYFVFSTNNENILTYFRSQYQQSQIDKSVLKLSAQNQQQNNQYTIQQNSQNQQFNQQSNTQIPTNNNQFLGQQQYVNNNLPLGQQLNNTQIFRQQQQLNNNQSFGQQQQTNNTQFLGQQQQLNNNLPCGQQQLNNTQFLRQQQQMNINQSFGQQQFNNIQFGGQQQQLNSTQILGQQQQLNYNQSFGQQQQTNNAQFSGQQKNNQQFGGQQPNNQQFAEVQKQQFQIQKQNNITASQPFFLTPQGNQQQQQTINLNRLGQKIYQSTQPQQTQQLDQYLQQQKRSSEQPTYQNESHTTSDDSIFTTQQINQIQEMKSQDILNSGNHPRILTNYSSNNQNNNSQCKICLEFYNTNSIEAVISPCCNQKLHAQCVQDDLFQKAQSNLEKINCFNCEAQLKSYSDYLKNQIAGQVFVEQVKKQVLSKIPMQCFKCFMPIISSQKSQLQQFKLECSKCHTILCSLCRQEYHGENKQNQQCPGLSKQILLAIQGMPVLVCPFCNLMQTKDQGCNHVKCYGCQSELCSACSADRIPIIAHGNHYHRKGCPDYKPWELKGKVKTDQEYDKKKCERCKQNLKACEYPISLEEYKKKKNF